MAVASSHYESHDGWLQSRRALRRRWLLIGGLTFAIIAWGPRALMVLARGWCTSAQVLDRQDEIALRRDRVDMLERQVKYARTEEGLDLEAKRQFGVGPPGEIWITIEAEAPRPQVPAPQAISDRLTAWLSDTGARAVDRVRHAGAVLRYWVGIDSARDPEPRTLDADDEAVSQPRSEAESAARTEAAADDEAEPQE